MYAVYVAIPVMLAALAVLAAPANAEYGAPSSTYLTAKIGDGASPATYNLAVTCTDAVLVYGLDVFVPMNDYGDRYAISAYSIRVGNTFLEHGAYQVPTGHMDVNLASTGLEYPIVVPKYSPLTIPIRVLDGDGGTPARATLDITYAGGPDTVCRTGDLRGPQKVGMMVQVYDEGTNHRMAGAQMAINDYNWYLDSIGEQWSLELVVKDDDATADGAAEKIRELAGEGISLVIGPSGSGQIRAIGDYLRENDMLAISCCSTAPSLAIADNIFRITPDDTNQAKALAGVLQDDGMEAAVVIYRNDVYGQELSAALDAETGNDVVKGAFSYAPGTGDFADIIREAAGAVQDAINIHGAERVAVVVISFSEVADLMAAAMSNGMLGDVRWYGSEAVVNRSDLARGDLGEFAQSVGLSGVIVSAPSGPVNDDVTRRLAAELDLLPGEAPVTYAYTSYDAVLILAGAMLATQSADAGSLIDAIPYVAAHTYGAMGYGTLNEYGDLAASDYAIWEVNDGIWVRTGVFSQVTGTVIPQ